MNYFKCYSSKLAGILIRNGFELLGSVPNMKKPQYDVFLFEDSKELRKVFNDYCEASRWDM